MLQLLSAVAEKGKEMIRENTEWISNRLAASPRPLTLSIPTYISPHEQFAAGAADVLRTTPVKLLNKCDF